MGNGDSETILHNETKEINNNDKIKQNHEVIFNGRSHNIYHSLQVNSRRDKSDKILHSEYEQKYNKYRKPDDTDNSYQNKNSNKIKIDSDSDSDKSEDVKRNSISK